MKRRTALSLAAWVCAAVVAWGWSALGSDLPSAKVLPLGEEGTAWSALSPGVAGGTFHMVCFGNPQTWNPYAVTDSSTSMLIGHVLHGLLTLDPMTGTLEPALAERWEISDDGLALLFVLRKGLRWSDGTPITADDVVFTYNDILFNEEIAASARDTLRLPDGSFPIVSRVDDLTVRVDLSMPFRPILNGFVQRILPKHCLAGSVHALNPSADPDVFLATWGIDTPPDRIVGSGPYLIQEYVADQYVVFVRNPYYYVVDPNGVQLPYYDRRVVHVVQSEDIALLKFLNGEIDAYAPRQMSDLPLLAAQGPLRGFTVKVDPSGTASGTHWIGFNQDLGGSDPQAAEKQALYRDPEFRQAFAHLMDKQAMIDSLYYGLATDQWSPLISGSPYYAGRDEYAGEITEAAAVRYDYDPAAAAAALTALGLVDRDGDGWRDFPDGSTVELRLATLAGRSDLEGECLIVADRARLVGLKVDVTPTEAMSLVTAFYTGAFDLMSLAFTGSNEPNTMRSLLEPCGSLHFWHRSGCGAPNDIESRILSLLEQGASVTDPVEAFQTYAEIQHLAALDASVLYTVYPMFNYAYYDYVGNAQMASEWGHPTSYSANAIDFIFDRRLVP